ncbi:MAG: hypothetical protein U0M42_07250 [Acutalibacteraceae bacterium]|nr:hypothetical protein [Acutalibacteraceae bacterium]
MDLILSDNGVEREIQIYDRLIFLIQQDMSVQNDERISSVDT